MSEGGVDVIFFASPSAVDGIISMAARSMQNGSAVAEATRPAEANRQRGILEIPAVCIGPTTAKAAEKAGFAEIYFPDEHTAEGMVNELLVIAGGLKKQKVEPGI